MQGLFLPSIWFICFPPHLVFGLYNKNFFTITLLNYYLIIGQYYICYYLLTTSYEKNNFIVMPFFHPFMVT